MANTRCSTIRDGLLRLFAAELEVSAFENRCVVTLPLKTLDDRYIDVIVEPSDGSFTYVHDGGKNVAELFSQGIHVTDRQTDILEKVAKRYGARFYQGRFQVLCSNDAAIHDAVFAVAQCVSLAMIEVVTHEAEIEEEPLSARVGRALKLWQPSYVEIRRRLPVKGNRGDHFFDWASLSAKDTANSVGIKLLPPSFGPLPQARLYGYMVYDIENTPVGKWPRLAVISKAEDWSHQAIELVRSFSTELIQVESGQEEFIEIALPGKMNELTNAA